MTLTYEEIEKWIDDSLALGGNDFIKWDEIKEKVSGLTFLYIRHLIALYNQAVIFKVDNEAIVDYTKQLLKDSISLPRADSGI